MLPVIILQPTNSNAYLVNSSLINPNYFKISATIMHLLATGKVMWKLPARSSCFFFHTWVANLVFVMIQIK